MSDECHGQSGTDSFSGDSPAVATVLDQTDVGLFVLGPDFTVEWLNAATEEYFGLSREAVLGEDKRDVLETELRSVFERPALVTERIRDTYENDTHAEFTCHVSAGEGCEDRWLLHQSHPIEDGELAGGRVEQYTDISESRRELEQKRQAIEQAPIGITLTGPEEADNPLFYANEEFCSLTGYTREEVQGWNHRRLQGPDTREEPVAELRRAVSAGEPTTVELRNYRKDGTMFWNRVSIAPIEDESGRVSSWVGFQEDITERKQHQRQLERQNKRLDEFASVVSHDLRNPLQVAKGRLEVIREEYDSDHLDAVEAAHDRMARLIDDLLALARSGRAVEDPETVALETIVEECWQNVVTDAATLTVETDRELRADASLLRQLLENLFRNSIKHGRPGDPSAADGGVTVTVGATGDGFYVADDGPGIPEDKRERVFESGYSTTDDGTGFGLAIVREVAEAHGWTVGVTESVDGGARFEITGVDTVA